MRSYLFFSMCMAVSLFSVNEAIAKDYRFANTMASPIQETIPLTAEVSPRQASEVQATRDGKVKEIYAWPGDTVGKGSPLMLLDDGVLKEQRKKLESQRNEYTAHLRRIEKLVEKDLVSAEIWDKNLQKLAQIRAELAVVEEQIENSMIRAPERGTVIWSDLKLGQDVKGAEAIYWIGDGEQLWLSTYIDEDLSTGLTENDVVAIFLDEKSTPVLGQIDFISFGGPRGGNVNLYVNAPRVGEIARKDKHNILVPIPSEEEFVILPENALTDEGYVYLLGPLSDAEPDKYMTSRFRPIVKKREKGVLYVSNLGAGAKVLLDPPQDIKHRQLLTALEAEEGWSEAYATAVLQRDNKVSPCEQNAQAQANGEAPPAAAGSCGGGCGSAGGQVVDDNSDPDKKVCLVPAGLFEKVELAESDIEGQKMEMPDMANPSAAQGKPDLENLPVTQAPE